MTLHVHSFEAGYKETKTTNLCFGGSIIVRDSKRTDYIVHI